MKRLTILLLVTAAFLSTQTTLWSQATTYTWNGGGSGSWGTDANWTPTRTIHAANDILVFDGSSTSSVTITDVPTETIGQLMITNNASVTLNSSGTQTLTVGPAYPDMNIVAPCLLTVGSNLTLVSSGRLTNNGSISGLGKVQIEGQAGGTGGFWIAVVFAADGNSDLTTNISVVGNVTINSGTTLRDYANDRILAVTGTLTNNGTIHNDGEGTVTVTVNGSIVNNGTWESDATNLTGTGTMSGTSSIGSSIVLTSSARITLSNSLELDGDMTVESGAQFTVGSGMTLSLYGNLTLNGNITGVDNTSVLSFNNGGTLRFSNAVVSHVNLLIDDDNDHYVEGTGTFTGCTLDIQLGYLMLSNNLAITGGIMQLADGSSIDLQGNNLTLDHVVLTNGSSCDIYDTPCTGKVQTTGGSAITQDGYFSAKLEVSGTTTASGTGDFSGGIRVLSGAALSVPSASTLIISSDLEIQGTGTLSGANATTSVVALTGSYNGDDLTGNHLTLAGSLPGNTISKVQLQLHGGSGKFVLFSGIANLQTGASFDIDNSSTLRLVDDGTVSGGAIQLNSGAIDTYGNTLTLNGTTLNIGSDAWVDDYSDSEVMGPVQTEGNTTIQQAGAFYVPLNVSTGTTEAWSAANSDPPLPGLGKRARSVGGLAYVKPTRGHANRRAELSTVSDPGFFSGDIEVSAVGTLRIPNGDTLKLSAYTNIAEAEGSTTIGMIATTRDCYREGGQTFGGLGVEIFPNSADLGSTTVTRTTGTAPPTSGGVTFIKRFFDISPSTNAGLNATFVFHYSAPGELNGITESSLHLYKSTNTGSTWSDMGGSIPASHSITLNGVNSFSRWTAGAQGGLPPTLTSISPTSAGTDTSFEVRLNGTNFVAGASVNFSGNGIIVNDVTVNSSTRITSNITITAQATIGTRDVSVVTPFGTATLTDGFLIKARNPVPTLTSVDPTSATLGQSLAVTLQGSGFASGLTTVSFGSGITVRLPLSVTNDHSLTAQITIGSDATTGPRDVVVSNPAPGGGSATLPSAFSVWQVAKLTAVSPNTAYRGQVLIVVLTGNNFVAGATSVSFGSDVVADSVTVLSTTQMRARLTIAPTAATGARDVSITNSGSGGGTATLTGGFTITNPAATITSVTPSAGGRGVPTSVTITGTGFIQGVTSLNFGAGISVSSIVVSSATRMTASVFVVRDATAGTRDVIVSNPAPGGGSATLSAGFAVQNPVPSVISVSPNTGASGQTLTVTVTGVGFLNGVTTIDFGSGITVISAAADTGGTHITASIKIAAGATAGERTVTATNPGPGGGPGTLSGGFIVTNPAPTLTSLNPAVGSKGQTLNVALVGTNFIDGTTSVSFGLGVTVNSVVVNSQTNLTVNITIAADAIAAARSVVVTNGPPGGGNATLSFAFNVQNAAPTLTSISPSSGTRGQTLNVTLSGTGFYSGVTTASFGAGITINSTTVNSLTQMTLGITVALDAAMGPRDVVVTNPVPGGGTATLAGSFTVSYPAPTLTSLSPSSATRSQTPTVTLTGSGFYSSVTSVSFGAGITVNSTTVNSLTQMTIGITVIPDAAMGPRDVTVTNPTPGGGTATLAGSFTVANPAPTITSVAPVSAGRGSLLKVTVVGTQFIDGVTSLSFGADISVTNFAVKSSTEIDASIAINPAATAGTRNVTVTNAAPGGGSASLTNGFAITSAPPTSIEGELGIIPDQYALQEAYPNPFNPSTRIRYGIPENSRIKLIVHNMLGNVVAELVSGERSKGTYELQWHADNLPSGVYLIRMNAESLESTKRFIASRKVVLVK